MLPKARRLSRLQFLQVKKTGHTQRNPNVSYIFVPSSTSRVAIVTSSKLSKKAVVRNQLRRHIYAYFQNTSLAGDIIIFPSHPMLNWSHEEIRLNFNSLLSSLTRP